MSSLINMRLNAIHEVEEEDEELDRATLTSRRTNSLRLNSRIDRMSHSSSISYSMLRQFPIKLSVLKLDGSSFDIEVMQSATVAELRQVVEETFSFAPQDTARKISWAHVWGHFCLCYRAQKLLLETDYIRRYGIKDGDELQFIPHLSANRGPSKKYMFSSKSSKYDYTRQYEEDAEDDHMMNRGCRQCSNWSRLLRKCFSDSETIDSKRKKADSRSPVKFLGSFRRMTVCRGCDYNYE